MNMGLGASPSRWMPSLSPSRTKVMPAKIRVVRNSTYRSCTTTEEGADVAITAALKRPEHYACPG